MRRLVNVLDEDTDARHQAVMQNLVLEMDNLLTYIDGISDERDSVPLLLAVRRHWPQAKAAIASLKAERDLYYIAAAVEQAPTVWDCLRNLEQAERVRSTLVDPAG